MLHYLVTRQHSYTLQQYLDTWARELQSSVQLHFYDDLAYVRKAPAGTWIFSDIERLSTGMRVVACAYANQLKSAGCRVLNDPAKVLCRFELLTTLFAQGKNAFNAFTIQDQAKVTRFPVFVRRADDHEGSQSGLLADAGALQRFIQQITPNPGEQWIIVEYLDTADAGLFAKYSAMRLGDDFVPRHVLFSRKWINKTPDVYDAELASREDDFVRQFPHKEELRTIFDLAHIDFGRIDYSLLDGKIQTWEINTNPMFVPNPAKIFPDRLGHQTESARRINASLKRLIDSGKSGHSVPIQFETKLKRSAGWTLKQSIRRWIRKRLHS